MNESNHLVEPMNVIISELEKDKSEGSYYYAWQSNIAMAFKDEFDRFRKINKNVSSKDVHKIANDAAKNFLDQLIK